MITDKEIKQAETTFYWLMLRWFLVSLTSVLSLVVIFNFILKNYLGYKGKMATCNDSKDGDFGAEWWLEEKGLRPSVWSAFLWWTRNHSWSYIQAKLPEWDNGEVDEFRTVLCTLDNSDMTDGRFTKANSAEGIYGINHYAYKLNGKVYFNYSEADEDYEIQIGAGGNEWRCWIKPITTVFKL